MTGLAHHLRIALAVRDGQSLAELSNRIKLLHTRDQISSLLSTEVASRRATRAGTRGSYGYTLTTAGRLASQDPGYVHSRFSRRMRGRPQPRPPEAA